MALDNAGNESHQKRHGLLKDLVRIFKKKNSDRHEIIPIVEPLSFDKGFFVVIRACQLLAQKNDGIILVGVAGPSGAGKTVFTEKILNFMPSIAVISMDNYNDSSRIVDGNFDDPRLTDYDSLLENVRDLKEGKQVEVPIYDFKSSSRVGYRTLEVPSSRIVIIEGIYALSERLRPLLDLRISVTGGVHFDLVKRVLRDIQRAGQEPEEIIYQISETVYPMYKAFIEPDLQTAHIKIMNKFNPFTGFQSPTYILKSARNITVDQIRAVFSKDYAESKEETYDIFLLPPGEDPESCQSYLRMRNKDGKYSLMFEEWVTDNPFVISPRITFEVSVRLLGGLMALGYTIATILKRSSHVFSDDRVCVKIDWLEQLKRQYIQLGLVLGYKTPGPTSMLMSRDNFYLRMTRKLGVTMLLKDSDNSFEVSKIELASHLLIKKVQGKDRMVVKFVAEQLGLDGSYTPRTYIEQIQLEKLINEVMALPDDLRTKLSLDEDLCLSPREALSKASADRVASRNKHQKSGLSQSYTIQRDRTLSKFTAANYEKFDRRNNESSTLVVNEGIITQLSEQISSLNDRMDVFTTCIEELNSKLVTKKNSPGQQNSALQAELCNGSAPNSYRFYSGSFAGSVIPNSSSSSHLAKESPLMEEISVIARGQRQLMHQLDSLSKLMRENLVEPCCQVRPKRKNIIAYSERFTIPVILMTVAMGSIGTFLVYNSRARN